MTKDVAGLMLTNPNTLGLFESNIEQVAKIVHGKGGLLYGDGACQCFSRQGKAWRFGL
jgi:glycine dehydrogenase subunit 2